MSRRKKAPIALDTAAGSRSYNRLDMQISQTIHMAIELYDDLNYLFILDHYDDITIFDLDADPLIVSYYQMKTSDNTITIDSAISGDWFAKLSMQLNRPEGWIVNELGLITNTPLEVSYNTVSKKGKQNNKKLKLSAERTPIPRLPGIVRQRISEDIAAKCGIPVNQVDLSKFAHLRTTLTIERHKDLAQKEVEDFLYSKYPRITVDTVRGIYSSLIEILTRRQEYERLSDTAPLEDVQKHKGFTRSDITKVIDKAIMLSLPTFDDVKRFAQVSDELIGNLSLPYVQILSDSNNKNDESFPRLFNSVVDAMTEDALDGQKTAWEYAQQIGLALREKEPTLCIPYDRDYIAVLTICLLINESRRKP